MRKCSLIFFIIFLSSQWANAQSYRNEWIDYSKTYYKFSVGAFGYDYVSWPNRNGIVRISQATLSAAGLGNVPAEQFQLFKDGQEQPIYISKLSGILAPGDYIEFWGEIANGKPDKALYPDSTYQLDDTWSLETDTASYFLTVNVSGNNKRFVQANNDVLNAGIAADKNFNYTMARHYRSYLNPGIGVFDVQQLFSSTYDIGEGWASRPVNPADCGCSTRDIPFITQKLFEDTLGSPMDITFAMIGNSPHYRNIKVLLNNDSLIQFPLDYFSFSKFTVNNIPANKIKNDTATFLIKNLGVESDNEMKVVSIALNYPRLFDFAGQSSFDFELAPSDTGHLLKIYNFNANGTTPVLYDLSNLKRYNANTDIPDTLQFYLPPSTERTQLALVRPDGSTAQNITQLRLRNFTNFTQTENQGDFLIITNNLLLGTGTDNYISQYRDYRSSDSGGHFNAKIFDIEEITDQFAYGIQWHPLSIKNFLRYARDQFSIPPRYAFLIGKGVSYLENRPYSSSPISSQINLVPTFGDPGSDNILASNDYTAIAATPIGRLSAISTQEVGDYLQKVKAYEAAQQDTLQSVEEKSWMKNVLQLTGASDPFLGNILDSFTRQYTKIISDTLFGGQVTNYSKTGDPSGYPQAIADFTNTFNKGSALVEYFGHSSSSNLDFNLDDASKYSNTGKYPVFIVNGCKAGNIFDYDPNRFQYRSSISEKFVLEPGKGAIAYAANSSFGIVDYLHIITEDFYKAASSSRYGQGLGDISKEAVTQFLNFVGFNDFYGRFHAEQFVLHGDPSMQLNSFPLPDYAVAENSISIITNPITVANDSIAIKLKYYNLGRAVNDSLHVALARKFPNGDSLVVFSKMLPPVHAADSMYLKIPIVSNRDKGENKIIFFVDDTEQLAEISETNNKSAATFFVTDAALLPVTPYNYSIINTDVIDLNASTANPLDTIKQYIMEMDTTALFNSPEKLTRRVVGPAGLISFPHIPLSLNNTVYYWRVAVDSANAPWNQFSFMHRNPGNPGFEQGHFFQHTESSFHNILLDSSRSYSFDSSLTNVYVLQSIYPTSGTEDYQFSVHVNGNQIAASACVGSSIIFSIFDPHTFKPVANLTQPYNAGPVCDPSRLYNFEYSTQSADTRKNAMDFLDNFVPDGYFVVARKIYDLGNSDWAPTVWAADTAIYGSHNSLYHRLKDQGTTIDSFVYPRTFVMIFKKNDSAHYTPVSVFSKGLYDRVTVSENIPTPDTLATITSPVFGPGKAWSKALWYGHDLNNNNISTMDILAIDKNGFDTLFYTIDKTQHEKDVSAIDANIYPYIQLRMHTQDSLTTLPYQLEDWRVEYEPVPEGALMPSLGIQIPDSLNFPHPVNVAFDTLQGYVVFKNISNAAFTPLKVKLVLYDAQNVPFEFAVARTKALMPGDTVHVSFLANLTSLPAGMYNLYFDVNPDNDQPEQYHFNNFLYQYLKITRDVILPVHLLSFTALKEKADVLLQWKVDNERNLSFYQVERSTDGNLFSIIGKVQPLSGNASIKNYSFTDVRPAVGKNYYRLKMIDENGAFSYSPIRIVDFENSSIIIVYPNPFHTNVKINVYKNNSLKNTVILYSIHGQFLLKKDFSGSVSLSLKGLAAGTYIVLINDGERTKEYKIEKQ